MKKHQTDGLKESQMSNFETRKSSEQANHFKRNVQAISKMLGRDVSEEESSEQVRNLLNFISIMLAIMDRDKQEKDLKMKKVQNEGRK